jgi:hypothetical protein
MDDPSSTGDLNGFGPRRRSTRRLVLSIAVALAAAFALYLFQPGWFTAPANATPGTSPAATATPTPRPRPRRDFYLGQAHMVDNLEVTPIQVTYTRGSGDHVANHGDIYAIVMLRFVNRIGGSHDYTLVPDGNCMVGLLPTCHFYVTDSHGEKNPPIPYDPYHTGLRAVVLQDGGYQIGSYTFEVPERDVKMHTLQLLYYHDPIGDANNVKHWLLELRPTHGR